MDNLNDLSRVYFYLQVFCGTPADLLWKTVQDKAGVISYVHVLYFLDSCTVLDITAGQTTENVSPYERVIKGRDEDPAWVVCNELLAVFNTIIQRLKNRKCNFVSLTLWVK